MPLHVTTGAPTLFVTRSAYERAGLVRSALDARLGLTDAEFRVEGEIVAIGPVYDGEALAAVLGDFERLGLAYYEDFFELSGNWPEWLCVLVGGGAEPGRSKPSQPHR